MNNVLKNINTIFMHEIIVFMHEIIVYKNNYFMPLIFKGTRGGKSCRSEVVAVILNYCGNC